jgi:2-(1,2-epoxy-1,2-dihydrophenyl)acetyl-CoA isomerase
VPRVEYHALQFKKRGGVAELTLDRPEALNAINLEMARDLMFAAMECDQDPEVRCVVLTGRGKAFCAGGDLGEFADAGETAPALLKELTSYLHAAISRFARMDAPLVAAVNGVAAGAGMSLVCAADLAFAGKSARFTASYHNVGLTPDASCTYYLARLVGLRRAQELLYTSRVLSADEAAEWGLVNASLEDRELPSQVNMIAERLALAPTWAIGRAKNLLLAGTNDTLETHMEHESRAISEATRTQDFIEGIDAFLNKRKARFTGT